MHPNNKNSRLIFTSFQYNERCYQIVKDIAASAASESEAHDALNTAVSSP